MAMVVWLLRRKSDLIAWLAFGAFISILVWAVIGTEDQTQLDSGADPLYAVEGNSLADAKDSCGPEMEGEDRVYCLYSHIEVMEMELEKLRDLIDLARDSQYPDYYEHGE